MKANRQKDQFWKDTDTWRDEPDFWRKGIMKKLPVLSSLGIVFCLLYTSPSPRDRTRARMPSSA